MIDADKAGFMNLCGSIRNWVTIILPGLNSLSCILEGSPFYGKSPILWIILVSIKLSAFNFLSVPDHGRPRIWINSGNLFVNIPGQEHLFVDNPGQEHLINKCPTSNKPATAAHNPD